MKNHIRRCRCWLLGHRYQTKRFQGRGRVIEVERCQVCGHVDPDRTTVKPANRQMRRRWARSVAREIAR